ncbi:hypothetical protein R1sor_005611 [Riccia sorocarpa]|uniref:Uncharacterized protein n=1 Tax=Riccia sorocarpa TaxID=122646 RepID=A0ABD3HNX2_9MARC
MQTPESNPTDPAFTRAVDAALHHLLDNRQQQPISELQQQQRAQADRVRQLLDHTIRPRPASPIQTASACERTAHTFVFGMELDPIVRRPQSPINLNEDPVEQQQQEHTQQEQVMEIDPALAVDTPSGSSSNMHSDAALSQLGDPSITQPR